MFILVTIKDTVIIKPKFIGSDLKEVIEQELNSRFSNKVVYRVGLCISLWDIIKIEESFISDVDGAYYACVHFRIVCFRPFIDEILIGNVKSCSKNGLRISLNFFDEIYIPVEKLRSPSKYDYESNTWIWEYSYEGETAELRIDKNDTIRFRVVEEIWRDPNPNCSKANLANSSQSATNENELVVDNNTESTPYSLIGSIVADGLGVTCWWVS